MLIVLVCSGLILPARGLFHIHGVQGSATKDAEAVGVSVASHTLCAAGCPDAMLANRSGMVKRFSSAC